MRALMLCLLLGLVGCGVANGIAATFADGGGDDGDGGTDGTDSCETPLCDCRGPGCSCTDDVCACVGPDCAIDTSSGGFGCTGSCECDLSSCACTDVDCEAVGAGQVCPGATCECGNGGCTN